MTEHQKLKARLTRAVNTGDPAKVVAACAHAIDVWATWPNGAWPDEWSRWQRALDDCMPWPGLGIELRDIEHRTPAYWAALERVTACA